MLELLLQSVKIPYKLIDEDTGFKLVKVNSKLHFYTPEFSLSVLEVVN